MARNPDFIRAFILIAFFAISCESGRLYELNDDFDGRVWSKDSAKSFEFTIPDAQIGYTIFLNLRNTSNYPFQNIYIQYSLIDSTRKTLREELMNFQLFHPQSGVPFGESGIGDIFDHQFLLLENYRFPYEGNYTIDYIQMMRIDSLREVLSVGTRIEKYQPQN